MEQETKTWKKHREDDGIIRVSAKSNAKAVSGSITKKVEAEGKAEIHTVGAGALNQAVKAIAMSRGYLAVAGRDAVVRPGFGLTSIEDKDRTLIKLFVSLV
jgi:stage V sporulation protein S